MKRLLQALLTVCLIPLALSGQEREIIQLQADIVLLTERVGGIQRSLDERNTIVQDLVEQLFDRVVILSSAVDRIVMTVDQVQVSNDRLSGELRVTIDGLADDLEIMDRTLSEVRAEISTVSQQMTSLSATTQELGSPDNLLKEAQLDVVLGNYELARLAFIDFLRTFPGSPQADDAQLGLGDSYYNEGLWEQAEIEYSIFVQRYPRSEKLQDALLKKGLSLASSGQEEEAVDTFGEVVTMFPETPQALRAQEEIDARN